MIFKGNYNSKRSKGIIQINCLSDTLLINLDNIGLYHVIKTEETKYNLIYKSSNCSNDILSIGIPKFFKTYSRETFISGQYEINSLSGKILDKGIFILQQI